MKFAPVTLALTAAMALGPILAIPTSASAQPADYRSYEDYCHAKKKHGQHLGTVLGAIGGAVIGSNLAAHSGGRAGGAVLGAAAGAAVGSNVGRSAGEAKCSGGHAYWTEDQTYAYDDSAYYHPGGYYNDDYYRGRHCRWAQDYDGSYIRVCRHNDGNFYYTR
jgi:Glycine zipper 2TM domain